VIPETAEERDGSFAVVVTDAVESLDTATDREPLPIGCAITLVAVDARAGNDR
jgi:hypothetical protein